MEHANDQDAKISRLLAEARINSFAPYFSDRVMRRLTTPPASQDALYDSLRWVFKRTSLAGLVAIALLCVVNLLEFSYLGIASSVVDTVFGLPSATISDALSYGAL